MWPSSWPRAEPPVATRIALACAAALSVGGSAHAATAESAAALAPAGLAAELHPAELLALRLNAIELPQMVQVLRLPGGGLALTLDTWDALHLKPSKAAPLRVDGQTYRRLGDDDGLRWRIDAPSQTLVIDAPAAAFAGGQVALDAAAPAVTPSSGIGGYANYDLQWQRSGWRGDGDRRDATSGLVELGGFATGVSGRLTGVLRSAGPLPTWVRLDTTLTLDRPERLASLRVGDTISQTGAWGRALRYGGVQWSTDFSMQPGFLSFPLPSLQGEAALPSTVDLYVNNSRRLQSEVPAGAFALTEVPIVTGQGQIRMVVRDLLGREQIVTQSYYVSPALLRPGLRAQAFELGAVREDYGLASDHYGRLHASATDRLGITDHFTREWRAEAVGRQVAAGATGLWLLPSFGSLNLSGVASHGDGGAGALLAAGAERSAMNWSGSLQLRYASPDFRQAGQGSFDRPRTSLAVALGSSFAGTAFGMSYLHQDGWQGTRHRIVALNAARALGPRGTLGLFALRDQAGGGGTLAVSYSIALGDRSSASVGSTRSRDQGGARRDDSVQLQRNLPDGPGFGYQLSADRGDATRYTAQGAWQAERAVFSAGLAHHRGGDDARAGVSGGLAWLGDSVFLSRRIEGSFAVVEVGGYPGVQVLHDQRPVARTDAQGRALVSGLRGYEVNRIGVDPADLPMDAEVGGLDTLLTPPARSGVALTLAVQRTRAASFRIVGADGQPLPPGSELRIAGQSRSFPVGYEGQAYVAGLSDRTRVQARWPGADCGLWLQWPAASEELLDLGTLRCE